jgi:DNA-binding NarL/FixJ family response regulator
MQRSDPLDGGVPDSPLRLVIADDHEATRTGFRLALGALGFNVAAEAADADSAIRAVLRERPQQCLIATHLPGGGIRAAAEVHARAPDVAIVLLDTAANEAALFAALDAGAAGYLLKDIEPRALGDALHGVHRGEAAIPRHLLSLVVAEFRARSLGGVPGQDRMTLASLTGRQLHVLELLSTGASTVEIGRRLAIAPTTVRRHLSTIVARLGVDGRAGAIEAYRSVRGSPGGRRALARRGVLGIEG